MIVSLWLEFDWSKKRFKMRSQEGHPISLVRFPFQAKPNQMNMIGHETIGRAKKTFTRGCVKHYREISDEIRR